jgi:Uma2 family endonuclease
MVRLARQKKKVHIGPEDDGRRMSLDDFAEATVQEGYLYELGKGVIQVSGIPGLSHGQQLRELRKQFVLYEAAHSELIHYSGGGGEAKLMSEPSQSERHPDFSLYLSAAPDVKHDLWSLWVPDIVVEIVSPSSIKRDYEEKPDEYLELGVSEYWIIDSLKQSMTAMTRWRGQWKTQIIKTPAKYTTPLLPGFTLNIKQIFAAAKRK